MITVLAGGWYRDRQDVLWMDAQPVPNSGGMMFTLYRSGAGPRFYTIDGTYLDDNYQPTVPGFNLVKFIHRGTPIVPAPDPAETDHTGVYL